MYMWFSKRTSEINICSLGKCTGVTLGEVSYSVNRGYYTVAR